MFHKVHRRLTVFCTFITSIIFLVMSLLYLYVSENNMKENARMTFENDLYNLVNTLYDTDVISARYLSSLEEQGGYIISIADNGSPLLYGTLRDDASSKKKLALIEEAKVSHPFPLSEIAPEKLILSDGNTYDFCRFLLQKDYGQLDITVLSDTSGLSERLIKQRLFFCGIFLCVILFLLIFFDRLTNTLLSPVIENQKRQTQFIASASHELRTPLSVVLSCASLLYDASPAEQTRLCGLINEEGAMIKQLIDEMLLLANSDQHNFTLQKKPVPLDTLVLDTAEAFETMAHDKKLKLSVRLCEDVLPLCFCDEFRIRQLLSSLIHNAISYTPKGSITVSLSYEKEHFVIQVIDTGVGIPDGDKKRIFERFYRADQARSEKEHFGLGLSIAMEIAKAHKGTLRVADTPGGGSTFILSLPA